MQKADKSFCTKDFFQKNWYFARILLFGFSEQMKNETWIMNVALATWIANLGHLTVTAFIIFDLTSNQRTSTSNNWDFFLPNVGWWWNCDQKLIYWVLIFMHNFEVNILEYSIHLKSLIEVIFDSFKLLMVRWNILT